MIEKLYDIIVVGGGLCGFACAVKTASKGKKVLLIERRPVLCWESTWACQLDFNSSGSAVASRIVNELSSVGGFRQGYADAPILEMVLNRLADEAGVSVLLYSYPVRLIFENDAAFGVVIGNKSGEQILKARVIVDATEEALLWRQTDVGVQRVVPSGRQTIFLNHAEDGIKFPLALNDNVIVRPSVWKGEVHIEFSIKKADSLSALRDMPEVIKLVRKD